MKSLIFYFLFYTVVILSVVPSFSNTAVFTHTAMDMVHLVENKGICDTFPKVINLILSFQIELKKQNRETVVWSHQKMRFM